MKSLKLSLAVAALVATAGSAMAADAVPYLMDSANQVVKSGSGLDTRFGSEGRQCDRMPVRSGHRPVPEGCSRQEEEARQGYG